MSVTHKLEVTFVFAMVVCACALGMKIDFSRLTHSRSFVPQKRNMECTGNPCPADKPFLCKTTAKCIALKFVCDKSIDCEEDGFDEEKAVCNAADRPPVERIFYFLEGEKSWILTKLFGGLNAEFVAKVLSIASDLNDLAEQLGLAPENVHNLREAFIAAEEGDERPLLAMGMPERSWNQVQYMLQELLKSGFKY